MKELKFRFVFIVLFATVYLFSFSAILLICNKWFINDCAKIIPVSLVFLLFFAVLSYFINTQLNYDRERYIKYIFYIGFAIMVIFEIVCAFMLKCEPVSDLKAIHLMAMNVAKTGRIDCMYSANEFTRAHTGYIARYQNNRFIFLAFAGIYRVAYLVFGYVPRMLPSLINLVAISSSVALLFFIAKKMFGSQVALLTFFVCFFFMPYYTYVPYFYTDSLSMPFLVLSIYLYVRLFEQKTTRRQLSYILLMTLSIFIGFSIKGSVIIVLVACIMYMFFKLSVKKAFVYSTALVVGFLLLNIILSRSCLLLGVSTKEELNREQYPATHWVMMGLNGKGGFNQSDSTYTYRAGDYEQKKKANVEMISKRLKDYGAHGLLKHFTEKLLYTWSDGTYYIRHHIYDSTSNSSRVKEYVLDSDGPFVLLSNSYQNVLIILICLSAVLFFFKPSVNYSLFINIVVFGTMLFFLIWETRSRYLFNFSPIFICVGANVMHELVSCKIPRLYTFAKVRLNTLVSQE